ncbi:hypothetical protein Moror_5464 [Moniliophthora roreri MCA 2997]|uniref:Uncharacterized protein n=2 Tax=Moniliophthora roreri TaxID=221103 RepID=V2X395_MONRO|nr:hypothetical protein Moror_5464 [Moniliophthora roreri MCA 2997]KAI3616019.1 hypothetical protein WG66_010465 [Moniliophthora roreri]
MKFVSAVSLTLLGATAVLADRGIISPAEGSTVSLSAPLNLTFNPGQYFKAGTTSIDVYFIHGELGKEATFALGADSRVILTDFKPNTQISDHNVVTNAYQVQIELTDELLAGPSWKHPWKKTLMIVEKKWDSITGANTAFWTTSFDLTE